MGNKKYKYIVRELTNNSIIFDGFPHRRHRKRYSKSYSKKKDLLNKIINNENNKDIVMISKNI